MTITSNITEQYPKWSGWPKSHLLQGLIHCVNFRFIFLLSSCSVSFSHNSFSQLLKFPVFGVFYLPYMAMCIQRESLKEESCTNLLWGGRQQEFNTGSSLQKNDLQSKACFCYFGWNITCEWVAELQRCQCWICGPWASETGRALKNIPQHFGSVSTPVSLLTAVCCGICPFACWLVSLFSDFAGLEFWPVAVNFLFQWSVQTPAWLI